MQIEFCRALNRAMALPGPDRWDGLLRGALEGIPGFEGVLVTGMDRSNTAVPRHAPQADPGPLPGRSPSSPETDARAAGERTPADSPGRLDLLLADPPFGQRWQEALDLGSRCAGWLPEPGDLAAESGSGSGSPWGGHPAWDGDPVLVMPRPEEGALRLLVAPLGEGGQLLGQLVLLVRADGRTSLVEWHHFIDALSVILAAKLREDLEDTARGWVDATSLLEFINRIHRLRMGSGTVGLAGDRAVEDRWLIEDAGFMDAFLRQVTEVLEAEMVAVLQRIDATRHHFHLFVNSWVERYEELPVSFRLALDELLDATSGVDLDRLEIRMFRRVPNPPLRPDLPPAFVSIPCEHGDEVIAQVFVFNSRVPHLSPRQNSILLSALGNHLAFRLLLLERNRELQGHYEELRRINSVAAIVTQMVDHDRILETLTAHLQDPLGIRCATILLTRPGETRLKVAATIGSPPIDLRGHRAVEAGGIVQRLIMDGEAFQGEPTPTRYDSLPDPVLAHVEMIVPFALSPQGQSGLELSGAQRSVGGLVVFRHPDHQLLDSGSRRNLLMLFLNNVSAALAVTNEFQQKKQVISALERLIQKLDQREEILKEAIRMVRQLLRVSRCSLLTVQDASTRSGGAAAGAAGGKELLVEVGEGLPDGVVGSRIPWGEEISGRVASDGRSVLCEDIETDDRFARRSREAYFNRSLLSVPLVATSLEGETEVLGVINVNNKVSGLPFTPSDQALLEAIARLTGAAIENNRLREKRELKRDYDRMVTDARLVQHAMIPDSFPTPPEIEVFGYCQPAKEVGGDFFDAFVMRDGRWMLVIGDVCGKGLAATIAMTTTRFLVRTTGSMVDDVARLAQQVNLGIIDAVEKESQDTGVRRFVTMQLLALDLETGQGELISAGHGDLTILRLDGRAVQVSARAAPPLGIVREMSFAPVPITLAPGETVLLHTDGLLEAKNRKGDFYGHPRVARELTDMAGLSAAGVGQELVRRVHAFASGGEIHDDLTLLVARWLGPAAGGDPDRRWRTDEVRSGTHPVSPEGPSPVMGPGHGDAR